MRIWLAAPVVPDILVINVSTAPTLLIVTTFPLVPTVPGAADISPLALYMAPLYSSTLNITEAIFFFAVILTLFFGYIRMFVPVL